MGSQQTYLLLPCHQRRDFWLLQSPQSILSGVHSRICPGESFHRCPPCTIHNPAHQNSPCQKDNAECPGRQCRAGESVWACASGSSQAFHSLLVLCVSPCTLVPFPYKMSIAIVCQGIAALCPSTTWK